jgi:hypothetical protein
MVKWIAFVIVLACVGVALAKHIRAIDWSHVHFHAGYAILSGLCIVGVTLTQIVAYRLLLAAYGPAPTWRQAATLSWVPALGKYVPGKIAAISGTVYLLRRFRISAPVALSVALMGDALAVLTGLLVGAPMLRLPEIREKIAGGWVMCVALVTAAAVCLYPPVFSAIVNVALRKLKRPPLTAVPKLHYYLLPLLAAFAQWACWGAALWFATRSLAEVSIDALPRMIVVIALANTVAYLVFFSPGGLGPREGVLLGALTPLLGNTAAVVVIALRLIQTVVEIMLAGAGLLILRADAGPGELPDNRTS